MFWIIVLGITTGMRTMTAIAVFCWFTWFAQIPTTRLTWWTANIISVIIFTALALGEYWGDTLPSTPSRKALLLVASRIFFAVGLGVMVASSFQEPLVGGVLFGLVGALIGIYGGYELRARLARRVGSDFPVAIGESLLALGLTVIAMHYVAGNISTFSHFTFQN